MSGCGGDAADLMSRHLPGLCGRPGQREPVAEVEGVADEPGSRAIRDTEHTAQLGGREVSDGRGALPTEANGAFGAR